MEYFSQKKIIISGANGFVGSVLVEKLFEIDCELILISRSDFQIKNETKAKIQKVIASVTDREIWNNVIEKDVDHVFHLAAHEHRHGSVLDPIQDLDVNTSSTLYLLQTCREKEVSPHIVFTSTSNIAGMAEKMPVNENTPDNPLTLFAGNKLNSERYLEYYDNEFDVSSTSLRLANVYGVSPNEEAMNRTTFNFLIKLALEKKQLKLFNNKDCIRDYIYIDDVITAMLVSAEKKIRGTYYVGSEEGVTFEQAIGNITDEVKISTGSDVTITDDLETKLDQVEYRNFVSDCSRFKKSTNWIPENRLKNGITKVVNHYLNKKV